MDEGNTYDIGFLNRRPICLRVSEGNSKFYDIGAASLHGKHNGDSGIARGVTGRNECDEGRLALGLTSQHRGKLVEGESPCTCAFFSAKTFLRISVIDELKGFKAI